MVDAFLSQITFSEVLIAFMIVYVASSAQSLFGMGWGMIAAPFLALLDPYLIPSTIVFLGFLPHSFQASDILKIFIGKHLGRQLAAVYLALF